MKGKDILKGIETPYIDAQTLLARLGGYQRPRDRIERMVNNGELIRLKHGIYLIADQIRQGTEIVIPYEQVANFLYGPSYVSLEWALSFYGMIPERVHTVTCMTLGKKKEYRTPIGDFSYLPLNPSRYAIGIEQKKSSCSPGGFLMASREKALVDWVFTTCKRIDRNLLRTELLESKRLDVEALRSLNKELLYEIAFVYRSKIINNLIEILWT